MRGTYEAFILVEVKDGRQFVCALNRKKQGKKDQAQLDLKEKQESLNKQVIWN